MSDVNNGRDETVGIDVAGGRLHAQIAGTGADVLLVHSGISDGGMWNGQFTALAESYRVARYDLRGFGQSSAVSEPYSHVDDLLAVVDALELEKPAVIAASMGARVTLDAALREPARFSRLVLVGPAISGRGFEDEELRACWAEMSTLWDDGNIAAAIDLETRFWINGPGRDGSADERVIARVNEMQRRIAELLPEDENDPEIEEEAAVADRLNQLAMPILVIVGEHDVSDIQRNAAEIVSSAADARIVTLPDTGHLPNMESVDEFNRLALEFLAE